MNSNMTTPLSNRQYLLWTIRNNGPITKKELQKITGLSWGLVVQEVNSLAEEGYISSNNRECLGVGRKAEEYDISEMQNYFVGVDLSYRGINVALADMKGRIIELTQREFALHEKEKEKMLDILYGILDTLFGRYSMKNIMGIGLSLQGAVDRENGVSILIGGVENWRDVPLKTILESRYHVPVTVEHDVDCIMLTETMFGHLNHDKITEAIVATLDYGIGLGMSLMINGQIYYGSHGKAGEIGYTIVREKEEDSRILLEDHVVKRHIVKDYINLTKDEDEITYPEIVRRAEEDDPVCKGIFERMAREIAYSICMASNFLNPEVIVFHMRSNEFKDMLFETIKNFVMEYTYDKTVKVKLSKAGLEAKAQGAILFASEKFIHTV